MASSGSMKRTMAILSLCAVFLLMADVQACSLDDLVPCTNAVLISGSMPTTGCCQKLATVDVPCICNLVSGSSYPPAYTNNAVNIPAKCGGEAYANFKGKVCAGHKIP